MPLTPEELQTITDSMAEMFQSLVEEAPDDEAQEETNDEEAQTTVASLIQQEVQRQVQDALGSNPPEDAGGEPVDDGEEPEPAATSQERLRIRQLEHVLSARHPNLDIDSELGRVQGLAVNDDGDVEGDVQYTPSSTMRRRSTRTPRPTAPANEEVDIANMTPEGLEQLLREEGDVGGAEIFRTERLQNQAFANREDALMKTIGTSPAS